MDDALSAGQRRKREMWEPNPRPEFEFKQSPNRPPPTPGFWESLSGGGKALGEMYESLPDSELAKGFLEDDLFGDVAGSAIDADASHGSGNEWDVLKQSGSNLYNRLKDRSPTRLMGSVAGAIPEELKAGLAGGKAALLGGKAALGMKSVGGAGATLAGILPTSGYRQEALRLGDIMNRRFQIDTPELEKLIRHVELAGPDDFLKKFTDTTHQPDAQAKLQQIVDLSDLSHPEEDITDEIARQMALYTNQGMHAGALAPPRRGSFPGLATTEAVTPRSASGMKTKEDVAGGPIIDYGRSGLRGIIQKRMGEGPGGRRILEKGSELGRYGDNSVAGMSTGRSESQMESAQTKIMELLHGTTPVAHEIEGGGTAQLFLPHTYEPFPYRIPNNLRTPEIANQLAAEQARDIFGAVTDRHTGQFMLDPAARKVVGVDKGFGSLDAFGFQGRLMPPDSVYASMDPYGAIAKTGDLAGMVDPDTYQRMAALGLSIPEPEWRQVLEPLMEAHGIRQPSRKDAAMRNFMQSIQGMPAHLDKYYRNFVKP